MRTRPFVIALVLVAAAGVTAVAARQVTSYVRGDQPDPVVLDEAAAEPAAGPAGSTSAEPAAEPAPVPVPDPPAASELAPGTGSDPIVGPPRIEEVDRQPVPDRITLRSGTVPDLTGPRPAIPPVAAQGPGTGVTAPDVSTGEIGPSRPPFGVRIWAEPGGHFATITVAVAGGPDGLAALTVGFGDGGVYRLPAGRVAEVRDGGTVAVAHRYQPTLDPRSQRAEVTATDGAGQRRRDAIEFETQAEFRASFSPLTVTALDDCDLIGRGDYKLEWNLEGSDRSSRFDLGRGESHVEQQFQTTIYGIHATDRVTYPLRISELDAVNLPAPWDWSLPPIRGPQLLDVVELGTHSYPVTLFWNTAGDDNCLVRLAYTYTVAMFG